MFFSLSRAVRRLLRSSFSLVLSAIAYAQRSLGFVRAPTGKAGPRRVSVATAYLGCDPGINVTRPDSRV